jgi:predicted small secreted protein
VGTKEKESYKNLSHDRPQQSTCHSEFGFLFASEGLSRSYSPPTNQGKSVMIKSIFIALLAATVMILAGTGCKHTAHGVGEDVEKMGEKIQEKTK